MPFYGEDDVWDRLGNGECCKFKCAYKDFTDWAKSHKIPRLIMDVLVDHELRHSQPPFSQKFLRGAGGDSVQMVAKGYNAAWFQG